MSERHRSVSNVASVSEPPSAGEEPVRDLAAAITFDVIGDDDRKEVTEVHSYPWRAVCHLRVIERGGGTSQGTGWLVGPRTVITAGHVVHPSGFAARIEVTPGRGAAASAHETVTATEFETTEGWARDRDEAFDYGAIFLRMPAVALGDRLGYFGFASRSTAELRGKAARIAGYSKDLGETLVRAAGSIETVGARRLRYRIDTEDGESGAPIFLATAGGPVVVGIHTDGFPSRNEGLRITAEVAENLRRWKYS